MALYLSTQTAKHVSGVLAVVFVSTEPGEFQGLMMDGNMHDMICVADADGNRYALLSRGGKSVAWDLNPEHDVIPCRMVSRHVRALVIFDSKGGAVCSLPAALNGNKIPALAELRGIVRGDSILAATLRARASLAALRASLAAERRRASLVAENQKRAATIRAAHHGVLYEACGMQFHNGYATLRAFGRPASFALARVRDGNAAEIAKRWKADADDALLTLDDACVRYGAAMQYWPDGLRASEARHVWAQSWSFAREAARERQSRPGNPWPFPSAQ